MSTKSLSHPVRNHRGQTLIEYLIIVALVGVGSIALMRTVSQGINVRFASVVKALGGSVSDSPNIQVSKSMLKKKDLKNFANQVTNNEKSDASNSESESE